MRVWSTWWGPQRGSLRQVPRQSRVLALAKTTSASATTVSAHTCAAAPAGLSGTEDVHLGKTKVFLTDAAHTALQRERDAVQQSHALQVQRWARAALSMRWAVRLWAQRGGTGTLPVLRRAWPLEAEAGVIDGTGYSGPGPGDEDSGDQTRYTVTGERCTLPPKRKADAVVSRVRQAKKDHAAQPKRRIDPPVQRSKSYQEVCGAVCGVGVAGDERRGVLTAMMMCDRSQRIFRAGQGRPSECRAT